MGNPSAWMESGIIAVQGVTKYYTFGGKPVAMRQGTGIAGPLTYLSGDHLGSVSLATDGAGNPVSQARFTPSGEVRW